jgi:hypothetical protein
MRARLAVLLLSVAPARAAATTVRFDALEPRAVLTDQLKAQGVVFEAFENVTFGIIEQSQLGKVANFSYAHSMEFPPWGARGLFSAGHRQLKLHVAVAQKWGPTEMILTGYDRFGRIIAKTHATVTPASGFDNELALRSPSPDIFAFTLETPYGTNTGPPLVYDLVFDEAAPLDLGAPDAAVAPIANRTPISSLAPNLRSAARSMPEVRPGGAEAVSSSPWLERVLLALGVVLLLGLGYVWWRSR